TADIEIDLVIADIGGDPRRLGKALWLRTAELQRNGMFARVEGEKARAIAANDRFRRHHLGVEQRAARQEPVQDTAVRVRPLHHRRDGEDFPVRTQLVIQRSAVDGELSSNCCTHSAHGLWKLWQLSCRLMPYSSSMSRLMIFFRLHHCNLMRRATSQKSCVPSGPTSPKRPSFQSRFSELFMNISIAYRCFAGRRFPTASGHSESAYHPCQRWRDP